MKTSRNTAGKSKPDYIVRFFITEFIICAVLLLLCFAIFKLLPETFASIRQSFSELTKDGFTLPQIGNFLTHAAHEVMEYLGVTPGGEV